MAQCIYNSWNAGCTMRDEGDTSSFETDPVGWDNAGHCVVEDDDNPEDSCQYYECHDAED